MGLKIIYQLSPGHHLLGVKTFNDFLCIYVRLDSVGMPSVATCPANEQRTGTKCLGSEEICAPGDQVPAYVLGSFTLGL